MIISHAGKYSPSIELPGSPFIKLLEPVMILLIKSINESILGILNPMAPVNTNIIPALNKTAEGELQ